jgi:hypothetical protein
MGAGGGLRRFEQQPAQHFGSGRVEPTRNQPITARCDAAIDNCPPPFVGVPELGVCGAGLVDSKPRLGTIRRCCPSTRRRSDPDPAPGRARSGARLPGDRRSHGRRPEPGGQRSEQMPLWAKQDERRDRASTAKEIRRRNCERGTAWCRTGKGGVARGHGPGRRAVCRRRLHDGGQRRPAIDRPRAARKIPPSWNGWSTPTCWCTRACWSPAASWAIGGDGRVCS